MRSAGRLSLFYDRWLDVTTDRFILECVSGVKIKFHTQPYERNSFETSKSKIEHLAIQNSIDELLIKGAIVPCCDTKGQFFSPYFLVAKSDGGNRFVLNLKKLNEFVIAPHFKLEDLRTAQRLISKDNYMCKLDLKDAFFLIKVDQESRKYLRFRFNQQNYEFSCLPFGLSVSPYLFTKLMKPIMEFLRSLGYLSVIYLDDMLCIGEDFASCAKNVNATITLLEHLGFKINFSKSILIPTKICKYLGFVLNSHEMTLELAVEKKSRITEAIDNLLSKSDIKIRNFARFIGYLTSACPSVPYGPLYCKNFERARFMALLMNDGDYDQFMKVERYLDSDLHWWRNNISDAKRSIESLHFSKEIFSDASMTGWGAAYRGEKVGGFWSVADRKRHINQLELIAAHNALKTFAVDCKNCSILMRVDNTTAIAYINKMGGIQYPELNKLARALWQWCEDQNLFVFASYIPSECNEDADEASRRLNIDTEWELSHYAFNSILLRWGPFDIDLFASKVNAKVSKFCSWKREPDAYAIDAFTLDWHNIYFYAFPPFALLPKILSKIISDKASGILVVPHWPSQPWYPLFRSLLSESPIVFEPSQGLLLSPCRSIYHPLAPRLSLVAGRLSGVHSAKPRFRMQPLRS